MTVLSKEELGRRLSTALELAQDAANLIANENAGRKATWKGWADWVTAVDTSVERRVREVLAERFPGDAVIGEELPNAPISDGQPAWYVDPIDGTTNFVHGLRSCSFSLGLADDDGLALGVVADPWGHEFFQAVRDEGARVNGVVLQCREDNGLAGAIVLTELEGPRPWHGMTELIEHLGRAGCVARILGSCALSIVNVAAGRASALVLGAAHPIDLAAGALIAREAGAVVLVGSHVDSVLGPSELGPLPALVAAGPSVLPALFEVLGR